MRVLYCLSTLLIVFIDRSTAKTSKSPRRSCSPERARADNTITARSRRARFPSRARFLRKTAYRQSTEQFGGVPRKLTSLTPKEDGPPAPLELVPARSPKVMVPTHTLLNLKVRRFRVMESQRIPTRRCCPSKMDRQAHAKKAIFIRAHTVMR